MRIALQKSLPFVILLALVPITPGSLFASPETQRELSITQPYLHLPIKTGSPKVRMKFIVHNETVREFEIEYDSENPDFEVFSDVTEFMGEDITIEISELSDEQGSLDAIVQADALPAADALYEETYRPQFHFTSRRGWLNDPNGLVYHNGEYHLYYQHNPYGWNWGNMHWGHAVSTDLIHWEELPVVLYPPEFGDWCFSGSGFIDWDNTSGFGTDDIPPLMIAYTSTGRGECIAYSVDNGRSFTEYEGNPVVTHQGRDPKILWHEPSEQWVMAVYNEFDDSRGIAFHTSADLKDWTFQSRIDGYYECPELFELPIDGDASNTRWIVYAADGAYSIGQFDGREFVAESGTHTFHYGDCFYASQTYSDIPAEDGRRIQVAWGRSAGHPDMPFNQQMNVPVVLTLRSTEEGPRLFTEPVEEIESLRDQHFSNENLWLSSDVDYPSPLRGQQFDVDLRIEPRQAETVTLYIRGMALTYDVAAQELRFGENTAPLSLQDGEIQLRLLVDALSLEIFGNDGQVYMPMKAVFSPEEETLNLRVSGGAARLVSADVYTLNSIW